MNRTPSCALLLSLILLSGGVGCSAASSMQAEQYLAEASRAPSQESRDGSLGPGDVFEVRVYQEPGLSGVFRVSPDGKVDFPLIGELGVGGLRQDEVASKIRRGLQDGYIREPYVTVFIKEYNSKKGFVLGQVRRPGTFVYQANMNIIQAVTLAGGFTEKAVKNGTIVTRVVGGNEVRVPVPVDEISGGMAKNFALMPGDIVFVPESVL